MWFFVGVLTLVVLGKLLYDWWRECDAPARVYCLGAIDYAGTMVREVPRMRSQDLLLVSKRNLTLVSQARQRGRTVLVLDDLKDEREVMEMAKRLRVPVADLTHSGAGLDSIMHLLQKHDYKGDTKRFGAVLRPARLDKEDEPRPST